MLTEICRLDELKDFVPKSFAVNGINLVVIKSNDEVFVLKDLCSHEEYRLSEGEYDDEEKTIECAKHGSVFNVYDGTPLCLPAVKPVKTFVTVIENGVLKVDL
jgi:3-phenylpropionate/trans-cinnamate dioxygenase ferredoxin subunit